MRQKQETAMDEMLQTRLTSIDRNDYQQVWNVVSTQLRLEMSKPLFESYVLPLKARSFENNVFTLTAASAYSRDWVENRLKVPITRQLEGLLNQRVTLSLEVEQDSLPPAGLPEFPLSDGEMPGSGTPDNGAPLPGDNGRLTPRKLALQRAYGSKRAAVIQPERALMVTQYFFTNWLPLIGHSALAVILAARSMCYWNPLSGELRNEIETEMGQIAERAAVSVRTVKSVLNDELVRKYFLRYRTRRVMTPNGVRTAGILLLVRMDDPVTPEDQARYAIPEDEFWYSPEFGDIEKSEENDIY